MHHAGSGIGLALVKAFVELHKGTISVESDEKQGTVFTVDLPVQTCETILAEDSLKSSISAVPLNPASPGSPASSNLNETLAVEEEELEKAMILPNLLFGN